MKKLLFAFCLLCGTAGFALDGIPPVYNDSTKYKLAPWGYVFEDALGTQDANPKKEMLCGGYTEQHELSEDDMALFRKVVGKDAPYTPLSVATQVVAGLNYRFWCRYDDGSDNSPRHCFVTIYQPLQGDPEISNIQDED